MHFGALAIVAAAGLFGPVLAGASGLRVPLVVGELLAGLVVGRTGFGWLHAEDPELVFLGDVGFAVLMLVVGTHLPLRTAGLRGALRAGALAAALTFLLALPLAVLLSHLTPLHDRGILVLLLATSSAAIVMPVLTDAGGTLGPRALVAVAWVAIADVASVVAIPVVLADGHVGRVLAGSALVLGGAGLVYLLARALIARELLDGPERVSHQRGWALRLRAGLLALFVLAWVADEFRTSVLIAGFSVGAVIALLGEPRRVATELIGLGEGFFVPLFFVLLGARLDVRALVEHPGDLGLLAALVAGTALLHLAVALLTGAGWATGLLAAAQLGVPAAVTSVGLASGALTPGQGAAVVAAALLSVGLASLGAARLQAPGPRPAVVPA